MLFGLSGASRAGKSTTAKAVAETIGIHFLPTQTGQWMREAGYEAVSSDLSIEKRLEMQELYLKILLEKLAEAPRPLITDRTPVDLLAYMACEIGMHATSAELGERIEAYYRRCLNATAETFDSVLVLRPLPVYQAEPDKAPPNRAYQWHTQFVMEGALSQICGRLNIGFVRSTALTDRVEACCEQFGERIIEIGVEKREARLH